MTINSLELAYEVFRKKWVWQILAALEVGTTKWSALQRALGGVNSKGLTDALNHLKKHGLVERLEGGHSDVRYRLTADGEKLLGLVHLAIRLFRR